MKFVDLSVDLGFLRVLIRTTFSITTVIFIGNPPPPPQLVWDMEPYIILGGGEGGIWGSRQAVHSCVLNIANFPQTILLLQLANMNNNCIHLCALFFNALRNRWRGRSNRIMSDPYSLKEDFWFCCLIKHRCWYWRETSSSLTQTSRGRVVCFCSYLYTRREVLLSA